MLLRVVGCYKSRIYFESNKRSVRINVVLAVLRYKSKYKKLVYCQYRKRDLKNPSN